MKKTLFYVLHNANVTIIFNKIIFAEIPADFLAAFLRRHTDVSFNQLCLLAETWNARENRALCRLLPQSSIKRPTKSVGRAPPAMI